MRGLNLYSNCIIKWLLGVFLSLLLISCEKEKNYPELGTTKLVSISSSTVFATASVLQRGDFEIVDHGFYYYLSNTAPDGYYPKGNKVSLGGTFAHDTFCAVINFQPVSYYNDDYKCFVSPYITDKRGTIYGDYVSVPIRWAQINSFEPAIAKIGDTISILGANFSIDPALIRITFKNIEAEITSLTANCIKVIVPDGLSTDYWENYIAIRFESGVQSMLFSNEFQLAASPTHFYPAAVKWNEYFTVYGAGMRNSVLYCDDEVVTDYYDRSATYVKAYVPAGVKHKQFKIYVMTNDQKTEVPGGYFTLKDMTIDPHGYTKYYPGHTISLTGSGFNPVTINNKLYLESVCIDASKSYSTLEFNIPVSFDPGIYAARVSNGVDTVYLQEKIIIVMPVVSGLSANSGSHGSQVIISGTNLLQGNEYPIIHLGSRSIHPDSKTSTQLIFTVPDIQLGTYSISIYYSSFQVNVPGTFEVL